MPTEDRQLLFFVSPRPIDFDSYLPTMMEMKHRRPNWNIKVICFDQTNYRNIKRNPVLQSGLDKAGTLHFCGSPPEFGKLRRLLKMAGNFLKISSWILRWKQPALFLAVPYSKFPYRIWYALSRLRGGNGFVLFKHRSPDEMHHLMWRARDKGEPQSPSLWSRVMGRDQDAIIYYHDHQLGMIEDLAPLGWIENTPRVKIGIPHLFPQWRAHIDDEVAKERANLEEKGLPADAELYAFFPGKPGSNDYLRGPGSIERVFVQQMSAVGKARPNSHALVRPHPMAVDEDYVQKGFDAFDKERASISFAHPEVMLRLCRRSFFNNPTNLLFHCFPGNMVDCSDYPDHHYEERGVISIADGLGAVYVSPDGDDFEDRLSQVIGDDDAFSNPKNRWRLSELLDSGQPKIDTLMGLLELSSGSLRLGQDRDALEA